MTQPTLFDILNDGPRLADTGLRMAVETAEAEHPGWTDRCWQHFTEWLGRYPSGFRFMVEDFRLHVDAQGLMEKPRSARAYGFISKRAVRDGLVEWYGTQKVKNAKAHATPANVWRKL